MHVLKHNLARFLIVALAGVWSHAAYQDCLAFMVPDVAAHATVERDNSPPCHVPDPGGNDHDPIGQASDHDCLGVCDCALEAIPISSLTLHVASEYKPSIDDHAITAATSHKPAFHHTAYQSPPSHEQPAAACLHPLQRTCIQLK